jgi:hypothetical protein
MKDCGKGENGDFSSINPCKREKMQKEKRQSTPD